jgi:SAM-dependent methyltransferase
MKDPLEKHEERAPGKPAGNESLTEQKSGGGSVTVEGAVRDFYDTYGWSKGGEDELYRQFRPAYWPYHDRSAARTLECFATQQGSLLLVGGGDLPASHVAVARHFASVTCIDISAVALEITRHKLPDAQRVLGSICDAPLATGAYDAVFAAHVVYHIDAKLQENAIREMIRLTKPGGRIVIIYNNPRSPIRFVAGVLSRLRRLFKPERTRNQAPPSLYFSPHPLGWWNRFRDMCSISMLPWEIIGSGDEKTLIPTDALARAFYRAASWVEVTFPASSVFFWEYPIIILDRK